MEENRDELIRSITRIAANPNIEKVRNAVGMVLRIVASVLQIGIAIAALTMIFASETLDVTMVKIFAAVVVAVIVGNVAAIAKEIVQFLEMQKLNEELNGYFDQLEYEELIQKEKKLRKMSLFCDLFAESPRTIIAAAIALMFVFGGIYIGVTGQGGMTFENLAFMIIFPLMGIGALLFMVSPMINIIKEIRMVDSMDWEEARDYALSQEKKSINMDKVKIWIFGAVFFCCGLLAFIEGLTFIPKGDMGQVIGMSFFGIVFMAAGIFAAVFLSKKSD